MPSSSLIKPSKRDIDETKWFEHAVNGGTLILEGIRQAAQFAPVPFLQQAADAALTIVKIVQSVKDNKDDFERLAKDAAAIVYAIWRSYQNSGNQDGWPGKRLKEVIIDILGTLKSIQEFVEYKVERNVLLRVIGSTADVGKIKKYRENLQQAVNQFMVSSDLEMHETLREIKQILAEMRASSSTKDKAGTAISTEQEDESVSEHLLNQEALERLKTKEREYFAERGSRSHSKTPSREEHRPSRESSPATSIGSQRDAEPRAQRSKKGKKRHVDGPSNTQEDPSRYEEATGSDRGYNSPYPHYQPVHSPPPGTYPVAYGWPHSPYHQPYPPQPYPYFGTAYGGYPFPPPPTSGTSIYNQNSGNITNSTMSNVGNDYSEHINLR